MFLQGWNVNSPKFQEFKGISSFSHEQRARGIVCKRHSDTLKPKLIWDISGLMSE